MIAKMQGRPRIAIAGATGRVGAVLTGLLASDPFDILALTRDPGQARVPSGAGVASVDFDRPGTIGKALDGTDRLFIAHGTSPRQVANEIALIDAAVAAGVRHIVKLSVMGPATCLAPYGWHMEIEAHLARQPVASTVLRPSAFADIFVRFAREIAAGSWTGAAGNGRVNFIDTRDVARAARAALVEDAAPGSQRVYHLTGPGALTMEQLAGEFSRLLGRAVLYRHRSVEAQRSALLAGGTSPFVTDLLMGLDQMFRDSVHAETTQTVRDLTGVPPRSMPEWITDNIALFR